jgi:hypothetical protein
MNIDYFKDNYPDIAEFIDLLNDYENFKIGFEKDRIIINYKPYDYQIILHESQLNLLDSYEKAVGIPNLKYLNSYGIKFKKYYEICLQIEHHGYSFYDNTNEWRTDPLKFKINNSEFEIGPVTPLLVLLMEPIYYKRKYYYGFSSFASIKMIVDNDADYKNQFNKALYYLNSHYLKKIGFFATIRHLELKEEDPLGIFEDRDIDDVFQEATRVRTRKRNDFIKIEPLALYNYSQSKVDEQRFLLLYRILEFFMEKAKVVKLKSIRYDNKISENELIDLVDLRNEEKQLENLLNEAISLSLKKKLTDYCFHHKLINTKDFKHIFKQLYKFRNSIVHAKESEVNVTIFPDPFEDNSNLNKWIYIVDEISRICINKYNIAGS